MSDDRSLREAAERITATRGYEPRIKDNLGTLKSLLADGKLSAYIKFGSRAEKLIVPVRYWSGLDHVEMKKILRRRGEKTGSGLYIGFRTALEFFIEDARSKGQEINATAFTSELAHSRDRYEVSIDAIQLSDLTREQKTAARKGSGAPEKEGWRHILVDLAAKMIVESVRQGRITNLKRDALVQEAKASVMDRIPKIDMPKDRSLQQAVSEILHLAKSIQDRSQP